MADYSIAPDFDVKADYLRKASLFMSSEKTRYYLKGVCLEPHPVKGAYLVATGLASFTMKPLLCPSE